MSEKLIADFYNQNHLKLSNFIKSYTPNQVEPADIVSQVFLILIEKARAGETNFIQDCKVNFFYVYRACVNTALKLQRVASKFQRLSIDEFEIDLEDDVICLDKNRAEVNILNQINTHFEDLHWYERKLLEINVIEKKSMRKISKETGITLTAIRNSIKNGKETIKGKTQEDFEDFTNGDFHLL